MRAGLLSSMNGSQISATEVAMSPTMIKNVLYGLAARVLYKWMNNNLARKAIVEVQGYDNLRFSKSHSRVACGALPGSTLSTQVIVTSNEGTCSSMKKTMHVLMEAIRMDAEGSVGSLEDGRTIQERSLIQTWEHIVDTVFCTRVGARGANIMESPPSYMV